MRDQIDRVAQEAGVRHQLRVRHRPRVCGASISIGETIIANDIADRRRMRLRRADDFDRDFLLQMIVQAAFRPGQIPPLEDAVRSPHVVAWIDGWMRAGDVGIIAEEDEVLLGAAWYRRFTGREVGMSGFVDRDTPVLAIAVAETHRGRGIGTALLNELVTAAQIEGVPAISLSVGRTNAALRLYERLGWERVEDSPDRPLRLLRRL